jgi:hypothetical protein
LSLDALLRGDFTAGLAALGNRLADCVRDVRDQRLAKLAVQPAAAIAHALQWREEHAEAAQLQSGARRLAMTIGRAWQLALLIEHAQWCLDNDADDSAVAAAVRFAATPIDLLADIRPDDSRLLTIDIHD